MNMESVPPLTSVTGDFVLAGGPDARQWLRGITGFRLHEGDSDTATLAVRGTVLRARCDDGRHWAALADLVDGCLADGAEQAHAQPPLQRRWRGRFAQLVWDERTGEVTAFSDHFASVPLYWYQSGEHYALASDLRLLLGAPGCARDPDLHAVYHYLNFSYIPAPLTICRQIRRIEPGTRLRMRDGQVRIERYYLPEYPEDLRGTDARLAGELRERIVASVQEFRPHGDAGWGCFLSGGTDSSSIVSILARQRRESRVKTCSIGFEEAGYDELQFARLAAQACGAEAHFDTVDRTRTFALLDTVVAAYDQPFGNASAIPTLACAGLGRQVALDCMLAGDGGDEIFGGNQRYAKDRVMDAFYHLPGALKAAAVGAGKAAGGRHIHFLNRIRNFTERASQPNPDRFYRDDSFASDHHEQLLGDAMASTVARDASLEFMRGVYAQGDSAHGLHRIMRLDLQMAIAQNDLVKVHGACKHHGVTARFPYLDPTLVDYTGRLQASHKVRGLDKRHLFKQAMEGILPPAILRKPKQGFGLPISVWIRSDVTMQARVRELLLDARTRARGWIRPGFVAQLLDMHIAGSWDYSAAIWQLLILELWMRRYMDGS